MKNPGELRRFQYLIPAEAESSKPLAQYAVVAAKNSKDALLSYLTLVCAQRMHGSM
jgi:hypothetical protein